MKLQEYLNECRKDPEYLRAENKLYRDRIALLENTLWRIEIFAKTDGINHALRKIAKLARVWRG